MRGSSTLCWTAPILRIACAEPASAARCRHARQAPYPHYHFAKSSRISMNKPTRRKIAFIGGGGVRTPLVVFGISEAVESLRADTFFLFDPHHHPVARSAL